MKKVYYFLVLFLLICSCSINKKLIFLKVDNLKLVSIKADTIRLKANAFFKNPNDVGGKITTDQVKVLVNDTEFALVSSDEFKVPARDEFTVPLKVVIPTREIFAKNKNGFLAALLNSVLGKSLKVQFIGNLEYKIFGISSHYPLDITQSIKIKL